MSNLSLTDDLNAVACIVLEAKSIADMAIKCFDEIDPDQFKSGERNQFIYAVEAISRVLSIADNNLGKLAEHYTPETGEKFASILIS